MLLFHEIDAEHEGYLSKDHRVLEGVAVIRLGATTRCFLSFSLAFIVSAAMEIRLQLRVDMSLTTSLPHRLNRARFRIGSPIAHHPIDKLSWAKRPLPYRLLAIWHLLAIVRRWRNFSLTLLTYYVLSVDVVFYVWTLYVRKKDSVKYFFVLFAIFFNSVF